ncbi:DUF533 domain-containing protein [Ascidiaceihabitans sp.]|uniref:DUF533 domain-containing protein n=1 Tax=Ascidiaceihabitans sp. TaxID=1872644 RepID=UPI003299F176
MSLMKTLAQVAIGVATSKKANPAAAQAGGGGLAGLLGGLSGGSGGGAADLLGGLLGGGGQTAANAGGGVQDLLGGLLGGTQQAAGGLSGGLGGLLDSLGGGANNSSGGGLSDVLGGLAGAAGAGGLLGGLAGALGSKPTTSNDSFGSVLNSAFSQTPEPEIEPSADQEAAAALMLRAMIQAAKCDGNFDDAERDALLGQLGEEVDTEEAAFVQSEMQSPVDVNGLASQVPAGMEEQIYAVSVLGIDLDSQAEAQYLDQLSKALNVAPQTVNQIHEKLGEPALYT